MMRQRRRTIVMRILLLALAAGLGTIRTTMAKQRVPGPGQQLTQRDPGEASTQSALRPDVVNTATLPNGVVVLQVRFASKPGQEAGTPPQKGKTQEGKQGKKSKGRRTDGPERAPAVWDGELIVTHGRLGELRLGQDDPRDMVEGAHWKLSAGKVTPWHRQSEVTPWHGEKGQGKSPAGDSSLIIELADTSPATGLTFHTVQGTFGFTLKEVPLGTQKDMLGGLVHVTRAALSRVILAAPSEDDFPSAVLGRDGKLYVAYVAFTHGKHFRGHDALDEEPKTEEPRSFEYLSEPTGGDQVLLLRLDGDKWTGPMSVTPTGQDVFRTAVAADGLGRVWVFWTAKSGGRWNLFARRLAGEQWSETIRLTDGQGPDIYPEVITDSSGRIWLAWQAFCGDHSEILAMRQEGDRFGEPIVVADGLANQWEPAIAASADGQVAIAWDTYAKGDYDVYCRVWSDGQLGKSIPVATSLKAQMRPSVAYDGSGRLWIAYEESPEHWGKDWGVAKQLGVPLYLGRSIGVRVWAGGKLQKPIDDPLRVFATDALTGDQPGSGQTGTKSIIANQLALPHLATDAAGRVWLVVRTLMPSFQVPVGSIWQCHATWFDGSRWSAAIPCPGTDNILDNRPAVVALPSGEMLLVTSCDGRLATAGQFPPAFLQKLREAGVTLYEKPQQPHWPDVVNNELVMASIDPPPGPAPARVELEPVEAESITMSAEAKAEAADITRTGQARAQVGGKTLQLWRGEFHRHTELSQDGVGDGMLMDMWRYALDAARLDWVGNGDHDNGMGREYSWWMTQKTTDLLQLPGRFTPMFSYERSCRYPDGHRNVVFAQRGVRTLPRLQGGMGKALDDLPPEAARPHTPDTLLLYKYLARFDGVCASHTSATNMGTDWRDNDPQIEPVVEIYQGERQSYEMPGAPRANAADNSIGGWRPYGFVCRALLKGYRLGFQSSSDHTSTHMSYCNCWVEKPTREAILAAMKARHVYGSTDNIIADVRCGDHFMGDEFTLASKPKLTVHLLGTAPLAKVQIIKDGNYVYMAEPNKQEVNFEWTDFEPTLGKTSYYYVRGEQANGELVWVSPMWITYRP